MKHPFLTLFTAGILSASLIAGAFAKPGSIHSEKSNAVTRLEQRAQRLEQHVHTTTAGGRQMLLLQRRHVQDLIARIQAGEAVDPREIDKLLWESPQ